MNAQDSKAIQQLGWWNPWSCQSWTNFWFNSPSHTNQIALDPERGQVLLSGGDSELQVVDISNPSHPHLVDAYGTEKNKLGIWGLAMSQDNIYLAYIRTIIPFNGTWSGVKVLISLTSTFKESGSFVLVAKTDFCLVQLQLKH